MSYMTPEKAAQNRAEWAARIAVLKEMDCSAVSQYNLLAVEEAIRRCPYPAVNDAIMKINGGFICGQDYDLCLAALLQANCLEPSGVGLFRINRQKLPQIEVQNELADAITIGEPARRAEFVVKPAAPSEPPPVQWGLF